MEFKLLKTDEEFVDRITAAVSCCEYFSEDEIAEVVSD